MSTSSSPIIYDNKSRSPIEVLRYSSVFYYESIELFSSEFKEFITPTNSEDKFFKSGICAATKQNKCSELHTLVNETYKTNMNYNEQKLNDEIKQAEKKDKELSTINLTDAAKKNKYNKYIENKIHIINKINEDKLGGYVLSEIIFKEIYNNSFKNLINTNKNTLFIFPKYNKFTKYLNNETKPIKEFYESIINKNEELDNGNYIQYINIFPENNDDDVETYTERIKLNIRQIEEFVKSKATISKGIDNPEIIKKIIFFVDTNNNIFIDYYKTSLQKKYVDVLNNLFNNFYSSGTIGTQQLNKSNSVNIKTLEKISKNFIINKLKDVKELFSNEYTDTKYNSEPIVNDIKIIEKNKKIIKDDIEKKIKDKKFLNNIDQLLIKLLLLYKIRIDVSLKKNLSSSDNSLLFNIYMRFENLDNPVITNELIPSRNVLYIFKSFDTINRIGYFTLENKDKNQYRFILDAIENKNYKDLFKKDKKWEKHIEEIKKRSQTNKTIEENSTENDEDAIREEELQTNTNVNVSKTEKKSILLEIRYIYGKIQYRNIQKSLTTPWNNNNIIEFYKTNTPYENYRFFSHRMIDNSFKENIDIKYYSNTLYDKKSLIEFLKEEKKYNDKTRLNYEFLNININNELLLKYNNFIYDKFKNNIDNSLFDNFVFQEKIKKNICEILFENNSLVYIKETNKVASTPKESATSDNYKISNYNYTSIIKKSYVPPTSQLSDITTKIKEYFMKYYNEKKKLKCDNKLCTEDNLPSELLSEISKEKKTFAITIVNVTKELDKDSTGILFASECKSKKKQIKQGYYDIIRRYFKRENSTQLGGGIKIKTRIKSNRKIKPKHNKNKTQNKKIKYHRIYSVKYLKEY